MPLSAHPTERLHINREIHAHRLPISRTVRDFARVLSLMKDDGLDRLPHQTSTLTYALLPITEAIHAYDRTYRRLGGAAFVPPADVILPPALSAHVNTPTTSLSHLNVERGRMAMGRAKLKLSKVLRRMYQDLNVHAPNYEDHYRELHDMLMSCHHVLAAYVRAYLVRAEIYKAALRSAPLPPTDLLFPQLTDLRAPSPWTGQ